MSKANGIAEKKDNYLQHVSLKNYKSIKDLEIGFKPGLNIIIGKNASGKTNFVNFLYNLVGFQWEQITDNPHGEFIFDRGEDSYRVAVDGVIELTTSESMSNMEWFHKPRKFNADLFKNNSKFSLYHDKEDPSSYPKGLLFNMNYARYLIKIIKYGVPYREKIIELAANLSINSHYVVIEDDVVLEKTENSFFLTSLLTKIEHDFKYKEINNEKIAMSIFNEISISFFGQINHALVSFTDISEIRISPNLNLYKDKGGRINVYNLYLEFCVNNEWFPYYELSDGSKRLFYIISEILCFNRFEIIAANLEGYDDEKSPANIILLEEPELGIHPHQLHKLMQFIKEQAREKQIILTTHSPQVLDVLGPDELDRIIICHSDAKNGTQLSHLTEKEMAKARKYMKEEAFLSDYWRFSDLEPAS